jgi:hypothetical protein
MYMTNEENKRENSVGLARIRERDLARRGLVGFHKTKITSDAGVLVNEQASELKTFEHEIRAITLTDENSLQVALEQPDFLRICDPNAPDQVLPGNTPNLPQLPPNHSWLIYRIPDFMESGNIIKLKMMATYNNGKAWANMFFMLTKVLPNNPIFQPEDIIYVNPNLALNPPVTGILSQYTTWYDQIMQITFNYPFPNIRGQSPLVGGAIIDQATDYSLYIICENWTFGVPPVPGVLTQMRVSMMVEDRGR